MGFHRMSDTICLMNLSEVIRVDVSYSGGRDLTPDLIVERRLLVHYTVMTLIQ